MTDSDLALIWLITPTGKWHTRLPSNPRQTTREWVHLVTLVWPDFFVLWHDVVIWTQPKFECVLHTKMIVPGQSIRISQSQNSQDSQTRFLAPMILTLTRWPSYTNLTCSVWKWTCSKNLWILYIKAFDSYRITYIQHVTDVTTLEYDWLRRHHCD